MFEKYLKAKPVWIDEVDFEWYELGLNDEYPLSWAKISDSRCIWSECHIKAFTHLNWQFSNVLPKDKKD